MLSVLLWSSLFGWGLAGGTNLLWKEVPSIASIGQEPIGNAVSGSQCSLGFLTQDLLTGCPSSLESLLLSPLGSLLLSPFLRILS